MAVMFHHFTSLPLELRQRIWELSMEPRRVPVGDFSYDTYNIATPPPPAPAPTLLHVCTESRSYLERYYVKVFDTESHLRYVWLNYDVDTVVMRQRTIREMLVELPLIRHLSLEVDDSEFFYLNLVGRIGCMPLLENFEIVPCDAGGIDWFKAWDQAMHHYYYKDDPVRFRTTVASPIPDHHVAELNPDNFLKVERDRIRRLVREMPDYWDSDYDPWESDEYPDRCEIGWRHAPGCDCSSSERWGSRIA